jgi:hypothetical protein
MGSINKRLMIKSPPFASGIVFAAIAKPPVTHLTAADHSLFGTDRL